MRTLSKFFLFIQLITLFILLITMSLTANPWGKDSDLVYKPVYGYIEPDPCKTPVLGSIGEAVICFHQTHITSCDGPRSNFRPSSSQYMLDGMRKYGFFKGFSMGCDRLMRENSDPWVYRNALNEHGQLMKWDPVP